MVAARSKQRRAMPIPAGANQSRHPGENGKLGLEARLPASQRKAPHRRTWAAAMRNQGNGMQNQGNGMQNHAGSQQSAAPPAFVRSPALSGCCPALARGGEGKGVCWGGESTFGEMGWVLLPSCVVGLGKGLPELLCPALRPQLSPCQARGKGTLVEPQALQVASAGGVWRALGLVGEDMEVSKSG